MPYKYQSSLHIISYTKSIQPIIPEIVFTNSFMESIQSWVSEHKLTSVGAVWASAIGASLAYTRARSPYKTSVRLIHARMHAQALTLAVLSGAAIMHYYEDNQQSKQEHATETACAPDSVSLGEFATAYM